MRKRIGLIVFIVALLFVNLISCDLLIFPKFTGNGTASDPYIVYSAVDFAMVRDIVNGIYSGRPKLDATIYLGADIDLAELNISGREWMPIGTGIRSEFVGVFDGQGHVIRNLIANHTPSGWVLSSVGLFGVISGNAVIKNVGLINVDVSGHDAVGSLVGHNRGATITNCYATGKVTGGTYVGGLIGRVSDKSDISNCYSSASVSGHGAVGGLIGSYDFLTDDDMGTLIGSYATGDISGDYSGGYIGGLVGYAAGVDISECHATGNVTGFADLGGLVGESYRTLISECYASGDISGIYDSGSSLGGLVGSTMLTSVSKCYATGNVMERVANLDKIGGLIGSGMSTYIFECSTTGDVSGKDYVGGLIGELMSGEVKHTTTSGDISGEIYVGGLIGKSILNEVATSYAVGSVMGVSDVGGLIGNFEDGAIYNCFAANPSLLKTIGTSTAFHRVIGSDTSHHSSPKFFNLYANEKMTIMGTFVTDAAESPAGTDDGEGVSLDQFKTESFFADDSTSTVKWSAIPGEISLDPTLWDPDIWEFKEGDFLQLANMP